MTSSSLNTKQRQFEKEQIWDKPFWQSCSSCTASEAVTLVWPQKATDHRPLWADQVLQQPLCWLLINPIPKIQLSAPLLLIRLLVRFWLICRFIGWFIHWLIGWFVGWLVHWSVCLLVSSLVHLLVRSSVCLLVRSFVYSFNPQTAQHCCALHKLDKNVYPGHTMQDQGGASVVLNQL